MRTPLPLTSARRKYGGEHSISGRLGKRSTADHELERDAQGLNPSGLKDHLNKGACVFAQLVVRSEGVVLLRTPFNSPIGTCTSSFVSSSERYTVFDTDSYVGGGEFDEICVAY